MVGSPSQYLTIPLGAQYPISKTAMAKMTEAFRIELKPFGIQVTSLEPNGVRTPMTEFTEQEKSDLWATFPEHLRDAYQRYFKYPGDVLNASFQFWTPEKFADLVYDRVIAVRQMKARYVIGPNAWLLPTINRWASKGVQMRIMDWDAPRLPVRLRLFNAIAERPTRKRVQLEVESVMEDACKRTGLQDFGDDRFLEPLGVLLQALRDEAPLSAFGRLVSRHFIVQMLNRGGQRHREPLAGDYPLSRSSASR